MLWLLADDSLDESQREKALLDAEELKEDDLSLDQDKVELDLDDAPFLDEEEEEEEEEVAEEKEEEEKEPRKKLDVKELLKDKRILFGGIGGLVLLLVLLLAIIFWPSEEPPPFPETPEGTQQQVEETPPPPAEHIVAFKPFWVEHVTEDGAVRLLYFKFSALTNNEKLAWELSHKRLVLRDAVFYYLKNKDLGFLSDKSKADMLKKDILSVVNQYLNVDQVEELLIEEYLVR